MSKKVIVGVCGGSIEERKAAVKALSLYAQDSAKDVTIPQSVRAPVRRGDALFEEIDSTGMPFVIASIQSFEEAEAVEALGGEVVHIEGLPSDHIPMTKQSILVTLNKARGRYITPLSAYARLLERAAA